MKTLRWFAFLILTIWAASCSKEPVPNQTGLNFQTLNNGSLQFVCSPLKIAVISDIHYLDPSLMKNDAAMGAAFQTYLSQDPKLLGYSDPIFRSAMSKVIAYKPDILLVSGDITKDGEKVSHETMANFFKQISDQGIKVLVIPGNHDVNNPEAASYDGDIASPVTSITADDFASIYSGFGYGDAISRDTHSLSYISQPFSDVNLWILAIDACKYDQNVPGGFETVGGAIKPETMTWILDRLAYAKTHNITVLGMMHHGILEHYTDQSVIDPGYVVDNWQATADKLIDAGLKIMFTGHYHANDITLRKKTNKILYDIETGSLVTPPSPYRLITLNRDCMSIETGHITSIDATIPGGLDFVTYSNMFLAGHLDGIFTYLLSNPPYYVPPTVAGNIAPLFRDGMMAHYAGDEHITLKEWMLDNKLNTISPTLAKIVRDFWTDLPPADNRLNINMENSLMRYRHN
ncbi:MAG: metallophosphoesterase [Bacteroidota bacterium]|nr:metallophosphoesterase [Bacteroidota bacterium]